MIITLFFLLLFIVGLIVFKIDSGSVAGFVFIIIGGVGIFFCLLGMGIGQANGREFVITYNATKTTVEEQRKLTNSYENAALTNTIIATNNELASNQFYARSKWTNWFQYSEILKLKPLK